MGNFDPVMVAAEIGMSALKHHTAGHARGTDQQDAANARIAQVRKTEAIEERRRRERLRQALATQRARFGAQGLAGGGSADAVLGGLTADTDRDIGDSRALTAMRIDDINRSLAQSRRRNLLETNQKLALGAFREAAPYLNLLLER